MSYTKLSNWRWARGGDQSDVGGRFRRIRRGALRFTAEVCAVAQLQHPNIVTAIDAGTRPGDDLNGLPVRYFVMEYIPGKDLDQFVSEHGPLSLGHACDLIHQIASALEKVARTQFSSS